MSKTIIQNLLYKTSHKSAYILHELLMHVSLWKLSCIEFRESINHGLGSSWISLTGQPTNIDPTAH